MLLNLNYFLFLCLQSSQVAANIKIFPNTTEIETFSRAFSEIILEYFVKPQIEFDLIIYGKSGRKKFGDISSKVLSQSDGKYKINVIKIQSGVLLLNQSAIILCGEKYISKLNNFIQLNNEFPKKLKFFMLTKNSTIENIQLQHPVVSIIQFLYILHNKTNQIDLIQTRFFDENYCSKMTFKKIQTFDRTTLKWSKKLKIRENFENFYNCTILVDTRNAFPMLNFNNQNHSLSFKILELAGNKRNFSIIYQKYKTRKNMKKKNLPIRNFYLEAHVFSLTSPFTNYYTEFFHLSTAFSERSYYFAITPGELYTSYEKILMPFDETTWWLLVATFSFAFSSIFVISLLPRNIQDMVYGVGIKMPAFNVLGTFFGIGQLKLPDSLFPRFILMMFILFCLVIRTAYQGVMFDMMTKDMRKPAIKNFEDILRENYTLWISNVTDSVNVFGDVFNKTSISKRRIYSIAKVPKILRTQLFNPSAKIAFAVDDECLFHFQLKVTKPILKIPEKYLTAPVGFALPKNHFLYDAIDEVIQLTVPMGIPLYWKGFFRWFKERKISIFNDNGPKVLGLKDLDFGFIIWLITCGFAILCFFCELFYWLKINQRMKMKEKLKTKRVKIHPINDDKEETLEIKESTLKVFKVVKKDKLKLNKKLVKS